MNFKKLFDRRKIETATLKASSRVIGIYINFQRQIFALVRLVQ